MREVRAPPCATSHPGTFQSTPLCTWLGSQGAGDFMVISLTDEVAKKSCIAKLGKSAKEVKCQDGCSTPE